MYTLIRSSGESTFATSGVQKLVGIVLATVDYINFRDWLINEEGHVPVHAGFTSSDD